jgi:hypothetical protein
LQKEKLEWVLRQDIDFEQGRTVLEEAISFVKLKL